MGGSGPLRAAFALVAGGATVFGFAPFGAYALPFVTLALLFVLWQDAASARDAAWYGFLFGAGLFGVGTPWVYIALNTFGGMPAPAAVLATAGFCAYLALFPALAGWLAARWTAPRAWPRVLAAAGAWTLAEWARGWVLSGFGWLALGYAQLPDGGATWFAGYAPVGGVYLVTFVTALGAAALALAIDACAAIGSRRGAVFLAAIAALAIVGDALGKIEWTRPAGEPVAVSLVQGNVAQDLKFDPDFRRNTFVLYTDLIAQSRGRLVVLPESAFPVFADEVPDPVLLGIFRMASARDGDVLVGMFTAEPPLPGRDDLRYYNSVIALGASELQLYRKRHLVPFGETIPLDFVLAPLLRAILAIPLASQTPGNADQPALNVAGQRVAVNICYEDAFGADIRPQAAAATMLVNVTNDAWYGRSLAAEQHNQIAAMRALEAGRPMLRATNTGITSAIGHDGRVFARLPWFTRNILEVEVTGRQGTTPYVRFGDALPAGLAAALLVAAVAAARRVTP